MSSTQTLFWTKSGLKLIDQTKLPQKFEYLHCKDIKTLWWAIKDLKVRGAPALGAAAAFGVLLGFKSFKGKTRRAFDQHLKRACHYLSTSRPTAVNLFHALHRMQNVLKIYSDVSISKIKDLLQKEAFQIFKEDQKVCRAMAEFGAPLIKNNFSVMTVCNAGALATVDYGTALGVFYRAKEKGKRFKVFACETRPLLQGARLTAWELLRHKIDTTLICDNMAATLMKQGRIDAIFTGADRIAANGDTANKIGTYSLAVLAKHHKIPFYVVAPQSTFDLATSTGKQIPIEQRHKSEVLGFAGRLTAPSAVKVYNPAFDVTDHELITAIVTEKGIIYPPFGKNIKSKLKPHVKNIS